MAKTFPRSERTEYYKTHRESFSENFKLRIHQSLSWLTQAEKTTELDFKFVSL